MRKSEALDIAANRRARKYSVTELTLRVLWGLIRPIFRLSPRIAFPWRSFLLRSFGARVGRYVHVYPTVDVFAPWNLSVGDFSAIGDRVRIYNLGRVEIGKSVTISQGAHLCAGSHDHRRADMPLLKLPILIADQAWVCADAFIAPGVELGEGSVLGARAVVVRDVQPWMVVAGNPAKEIARREMVSCDGRADGEVASSASGRADLDGDPNIPSKSSLRS